MVQFTPTTAQVLDLSTQSKYLYHIGIFSHFTTFNCWFDLVDHGAGDALGRGHTLIDRSLMLLHVVLTGTSAMFYAVMSPLGVLDETTHISGFRLFIEVFVGL